jgi:predicted nucleic acid-binding Zn ribbon protein
MATYIYESIPGKPNEKPKRYEIKQSMKDQPLTVHPESGEKIRRVLSGGFGLVTKSGSSQSPSMKTSHSCGSANCCH